MPKIKLYHRLNKSYLSGDIILFPSANKLITDFVQNEFKCKRQHTSLSRLMLNDLNN